MTFAIGALMVAMVNGSISPRVSPPFPPPPAGRLLWSADTETGDVSQWARDQVGESVFNSGTGSVVASTDVAHSGRYSLKMSIAGADGETQAARILRWHDTPAEGYYSVWFDFPQVYRPAQWWNVLQFKSVGSENVPVWILNVGNRDDGLMYFYLWDALTRTSYSPLRRLNIPTQRWMQVKVYLRRSTGQSGRITVWQDGVLLFDVDQVQTAVGNNTHFGIGNYTDQITPPNAVIYADDAEIRAVTSLASTTVSSGTSAR